jgi:hypothetical protein
MSNRIASIALLAAATALSACGGKRSSTEAVAGPTVCFKTSEVSSISPVNSETALLRVGARAYQLSIVGVCPDLNWSTGIVLTSETSDATTLCTGQPVTVQSPSPRGGVQQCFGNELTLTQ